MKKTGAFYRVLILCLGLFMAGCTGPEKAPVSASSAETEQETRDGEPVVIETEPETSGGIQPEEEVIQMRTEQDGMIHSYLTGELVPVSQGKRRPLAIVMSNDRAALPQYGINRAGVVYEAPVEGGMNRYLAVMEDYDDLERIGSVRSCRNYYIYLAREYEALYAHYGQSTFAKPYLKYIDNINGISGNGTQAYFRAGDKRSPHNAYASFAGIQQAVSRSGYSQEYPESYQGHFRFVAPGKHVRLKGADAREAWKIEPGYKLNNPWFEYHPEDGLYYRYQYGGSHEGSEGQIKVKNIIIQYCSAGYYASTDYRNINLHEDSWGYLITEGMMEDITWKKDGDFGVTHYYDASGQEIVLNPGKTWVCIIPTDDYVPLKAEGPAPLS